MAVKAWYYNFMKRHPKFSLRQPESTSLARCKGFSRENVNHFYVILENLVDQYKIDSTKIYNVDESGFPQFRKKAKKLSLGKEKRTSEQWLAVNGELIPHLLFRPTQRDTLQRL
nr:unnamed protein product [Callosobruchus chinensis]